MSNCWCEPATGCALEPHAPDDRLRGVSLAMLKKAKVLYVNPNAHHDSKGESNDVAWMRATFKETRIRSTELHDAAVVIWRPYHDGTVPSYTARVLLEAHTAGRRCLRLHGSNCSGLILYPDNGWGADILTDAETNRRDENGEM